MLSYSQYTSRREKPVSPKWKVFSLLVVFAVFASLALTLRGSFLGLSPAKEAGVAMETISFADGQTIVNTSGLSDAKGYGGPVPVRIYISGEHIDSVVALPNSESPSFFSRLASEGLVSAWDGKSLAEADTLRVDAVSGATFSSRAFIANVRAGIDAATDSPLASSHSSGFSWAALCALIVALLAAVGPFFIKNKKYKTLQQILNVGVLGFWTGTFLDYAIIVNTTAYGLSFSLAGITTILLLIVAFIYPLLGRPGHYCAWVCPMGSLQELAGLLSKTTFQTSAHANHIISIFRNILWGILIFLLWLGIGTEWLDNEIFIAFIVRSASLTVIIIGFIFILLSVFMPRPFCRMICPLGTILRKSSDLEAK